MKLPIDFGEDAFPITKSDTLDLVQDPGNSGAVGAKYPLCVVYTGSGGDIKVTTARGTVVTFAGTQPGDRLPLAVKRIWSTGTVATNMVAIVN